MLMRQPSTSWKVLDSFTICQIRTTSNRGERCNRKGLRNEKSLECAIPVIWNQVVPLAEREGSNIEPPFPPWHNAKVPDTKGLACGKKMRFAA